MKKLSVLLAIIMIVGLFSSCAEDPKPRYEFSYEIEKTEILRL